MRAASDRLRAALLALHDVFVDRRGQGASEIVSDRRADRGAAAGLRSDLLRFVDRKDAFVRVDDLIVCGGVEAGRAGARPYRYLQSVDL